MSLFKQSQTVVSLLLLASLLSGCEASSTIATSLPALPIVQQAINRLVPAINGQRNELMMSQVCALARGETTPEIVTKFMSGKGIDISKVPTQGHELSIFVNPDASKLAAACAAYIATSVGVLPKPEEFMSEIKGDAKESGSKVDLKIDPLRLNLFLGTQLAIAKADAEIFALIAIELGKSPGLTLEQYDEKTRSIFTRLAPMYLLRVNYLYAGEEGTRYQMLEYSDSVFRFISSSGYKYEYGYEGTHLSFNRMPWLGGDKILGKVYKLKVDYLDVAFKDTLLKKKSS